MTEKVSEPVNPEKLLSDFYVFINLIRDIDVPIQFPIRIGSNDFLVSYFGIEDKKLKFGIFIGQQKYSRKTLEIDENGNVEEDKIGIIPDFDKTDHEPDFSSVSDVDIALQVMNKLVKELKIKSSN